MLNQYTRIFESIHKDILDLPPKIKSSRLPDGIYQIFKELIPVLFKLFKIEEEKIPSNPFNNTRIILMTKLDKETTRKENYRQYIPDKDR